jgi:hypothetical protein
MSFEIPTDHRKTPETLYNVRCGGELLVVDPATAPPREGRAGSITLTAYLRAMRRASACLAACWAFGLPLYYCYCYCRTPASQARAACRTRASVSDRRRSHASTSPWWSSSPRPCTCRVGGALAPNLAPSATCICLSDLVAARAARFRIATRWACSHSAARSAARASPCRARASRPGSLGAAWRACG